MFIHVKWEEYHFTELLLGDINIINVKDFCKLYKVDILTEISKSKERNSRKARFAYVNNCQI